jgi:hypothetical protein
VSNKQVEVRKVLVDEAKISLRSGKEEEKRKLNKKEL